MVIHDSGAALGKFWGYDNVRDIGILLSNGTVPQRVDFSTYRRRLASEGAGPSCGGTTDNLLVVGKTRSNIACCYSIKLV
jgi:hypothetical protein